MSSDQGIAQNLPKSPEPAGKDTNLQAPAVEKANETRRFGLLLRRRRRSSAGGRRRVRETTAAEDETRRFAQRWRSQRAQRVYSLKLYDAIHRSRRSTAAGNGGVRDTADRVLATAARGTTRWSRAIMLSRPGSRQTAKVTAPAAARGMQRRRVGMRNPAAEGNGYRVLAQLVPGCRRTELPELLNETADYIAALEMQVRAMTALAEILADSQPFDRDGSARIVSADDL